MDNATRLTEMGAAGLGGTPDGVLGENSMSINFADRKLIKKAMRKGVRFSLFGMYEDGSDFDEHVVILTPLSHMWSDAARSDAQDFYGSKLWGQKWRDDDGTPHWPSSVLHLIRARWMVSTITAWEGPPIDIGRGDVDLSELATPALRSKLREMFCPDFEFGTHFDEEAIKESFDDSDYDTDFVGMIEACHKEWKRSIDSVKYLNAYNVDPTLRQFLVSPGNSLQTG